MTLHVCVQRGVMHLSSDKCIFLVDPSIFKISKICFVFSDITTQDHTISGSIMEKI